MTLRCVNGPCYGAVYDPKESAIVEGATVRVAHPTEHGHEVPYRVVIGALGPNLVWDGEPGADGTPLTQL